MMWLTSPVTHFLTDVSQGTSPNLSKGWGTRELTLCNEKFDTIGEFLSSNDFVTLVQLRTSLKCYF